jgi:hypothetical protein
MCTFNKKQVEGWSSGKETSRRMECIIENKEMDRVSNRKQREGWSVLQEKGEGWSA